MYVLHLSPISSTNLAFQASFLIPLASITNFVELVLILPAIYVILSKVHLQAAVKDLLVSRGSALFMALGSFGLALSAARGLFVMCKLSFLQYLQYLL